VHLRSLRLRGFKSFAEPVELRFERGVAVIVGPNGSGKSNVAEALQWAMASQPPSELRAATGMDVLFNGSARRAPSGFAEVELVLDNEDGGFGSGRPEVSVMRRLTREGDSSYLLNRVAVRRLDVQEALADAGLGRELHAIVSQGRVEEILLSKPADRRGYIRMFDGARSHFEQWEVSWLNADERRRGYEEGYRMNACSYEEARERQNMNGHPWRGERLKRAFTYKAMNRRIQGNAARQMKMAMAQCWEEGLVPMLQMHDELSFSLHDPDQGARIEEIMRTVYTCSVPFLVDAEWGSTWGDAKHSFKVAEAGWRENRR